MTIPLLYGAAEKSKIDSMCYYYTKNGKPDVIEIDGMEYHLDDNGLINQVDRTGINPFHYEILANVSRNCVRVDVSQKGK